MIIFGLFMSQSAAFQSYLVGASDSWILTSNMGRKCVSLLTKGLVVINGFKLEFELTKYIDLPLVIKIQYTSYLFH